MSDDFHPDYEALLDSVSGVVWEVEPETFQFRFVSRQAEPLLGYPVEQWLKERDFWIHHMHPEDRSWAPEYCRAATARLAPHELEYRMIAADGRVVWVRDVCSVLVEDGRAVSLRGVMIDVTEAKLTNEALRVSTERLETVVRNAPVVLFAVDREGITRLCEGKGLEAAGIESHEIVGLPLAVWSRSSEQILRNVRRGMAGEAFDDTVTFEGRVYQVRYQPVVDASGAPDGLIGVATDITERVRAEEEHRSLEAQVRHSQKLESLGVLAGGIAHDFNNLLMTIRGSAELLRAELPVASEARDHVERIRRAARTATDLTNQLLAYSGQGRFDIGPVNLSELVADLADLLRVSISKKAALECELGPELPAVQADAAQLAQVVMNLITNASEALADEPGTIRVRTGSAQLAAADRSCRYPPEGLPAGRYAFVEVADSGCGMDEETLGRIFDPFFTTKFVGRGLGLATVLGIVRGHRGAIDVESRPEKGTRFRILLPAGGEVPRATPPEPKLRWRGRGTVLVVDDDPDVRELAGEMIRRLGFEVVAAGNGREAVALLGERGEAVAAVLLDVTMPEMSGGEAARELLQLRPGTPVVLMSGYREEYALGELPAGVVAGFLQKPFGPEQLARLLASLLPAREGS